MKVLRQPPVWLLRVLVLVAILLVWHVGTTLASSPYFPQPAKVFERVAELFLPTAQSAVPQGLVEDLLPGFGRMLVGYFIAIVVGVMLGAALGLVEILDDLGDWVMQFLRAVPPPALFPVFLVLFGTGDAMRITLIAFGTVWPILLNTIEGVRAADGGMREAAKVYRISAWDRFMRIILPAAAPTMLAGIRTSLALGLILMVISEMVAATNGLGFQLLQSQRSFNTLGMWAAILALAILGYLSNLGLTFVERRVLRWQRLSGKETA